MKKEEEGGVTMKKVIILGFCIFVAIAVFMLCSYGQVLSQDQQILGQDQDIVKVRKTSVYIIIDYYDKEYHNGKVLAATYYHFLPKHTRHDEYSGMAVFYRKSPVIKAWINHAGKVVIVHRGETRHDCRDWLPRYLMCNDIEESLRYWKRRLEIPKIVREYRGKMLRENGGVM